MTDKTLTAEAKLKRIQQLMSQHPPTSKLYQSMASQLQPLIMQAKAERQEIAKLQVIEAKRQKAKAKAEEEEEEEERQAEATPKHESVSETPTPMPQAHSLVAEASEPVSGEIAPLPDVEDKQKTKKIYQPAPQKLFQSLARIEGSLEVKDGRLVLVTKADKAELKVVQIRGEHTAKRLLVRQDNCRQGLFSVYPEVEGVMITNFCVGAAQPDPHVPPVDQMYISGKLVRRGEDAFFVDIGRHKRTHRAKQQFEIPLKIEGESAPKTWQRGQWIGLVLHRQGTDWHWQGELREILKGQKRLRPVEV